MNYNYNRETEVVIKFPANPETDRREMYILNGRESESAPMKMTAYLSDAEYQGICYPRYAMSLNAHNDPIITICLYGPEWSKDFIAQLSRPSIRDGYSEIHIRLQGIWRKFSDPQLRVISEEVSLLDIEHQLFKIKTNVIKANLLTGCLPGDLGFYLGNTK